METEEFEYVIIKPVDFVPGQVYSIKGDHEYNSIKFCRFERWIHSEKIMDFLGMDGNYHKRNVNEKEHIDGLLAYPHQKVTFEFKANIFNKMHENQDT